jgi:hypothetical protein
MSSSLIVLFLQIGMKIAQQFHTEFATKKEAPRELKT